MTTITCGQILHHLEGNPITCSVGVKGDNMIYLKRTALHSFCVVSHDFRQFKGGRRGDLYFVCQKNMSSKRVLKYKCHITTVRDESLFQ